MDEARHERIRAVVAAIPVGRWCGYGDVAAAAGERSARVVGTVLATDGSDLPWHRVLRAGGTSAPHLADEQQRRLAAEGVPLRAGRADPAYRCSPFPPAVEDAALLTSDVSDVASLAPEGAGRTSSSTQTPTPSRDTAAPSTHTPTHPTRG